MPGSAADFTELFSRCSGQEFLVFSIDSDLSFYPAEQAKLVHALKKVHVPVMWITVHSDKGHDSFLIEPKLFTPHLSHALNRKAPTIPKRPPLRRPVTKAAGGRKRR
jgi:homoserine O-acetyltransferase